MDTEQAQEREPRLDKKGARERDKARVFGRRSVLDLGLLIAALRLPSTRRGKLSAAASVLGVAAFDFVSTRRAGRALSKEDLSVTINRPIDVCYDAWLEHTEHPRLFQRLDNVIMTGDRQVTWLGRAGAGVTRSWQLELIAQAPNDAMTWKTEDELAGYTVAFRDAPGGRGTEVHLHVLGGDSFATFFGGHEAERALMRFKAFLETGEIATTVGQPSGKRSMKGGMLLKGRMS